jgi:hypothetical protein
MNSPKLRRYRINIALVTATFLAGFSGIEIFIRVTQPIAINYVATPGMDYVLKPNKTFDFKQKEFHITVKTNEIGIRDETVNTNVKNRILFLDDSFVFGYGVEHAETVSTRLEHYLNNGQRTEFTVINAGHSGYDTRREFNWLKEHGDRLKPNTIIIGFVLNDVLSNSGDFFFSPIPLGPLKYLPFEGTASALSYAIRNPAHLLFKLGLKQSYTELDHFDCLRPQRCQAGWSATYNFLEKIKQNAKQLGANVILARIPVYEELQKFAGVEPYFPSLAVSKLSNFAKKLGFGFVDFAEAPNLKAETSYYPIDRHWNAHGHDIAAKLLARYVK